MTEAYYIAAECLKDSDPKRAIELLNLVRENRNLSLFPLADNLTADEIQNEIYKRLAINFSRQNRKILAYIV